MADLTNVEPELAARIRGMQDEAGQRGLVLVITCGWRSLADEQRLYALMIAAQKQYGSRVISGKPAWQYHAALAAVPGTSHHGFNPSQAVDLACANPNAYNRGIHGQLAAEWGLARTVSSEYWHLELGPSRKPMPVTPKEQAMTLVISPVGSVDRLGVDADGWAFGAHGHVYAYGAAQFHGGWDDPTRNDPTRWCVALVPTINGNGYFVVSNKGEVWAYGSAVYPGGYQAAWGPGQIIGAVPNHRSPGGSVTLLRDDGSNLDIYALPA